MSVSQQMKSLANERDLSAFWMPFTANRQFKGAPRMLVAAQDMHYTADDGRKILDAVAGLWCCNAGHNRPRVVEAIRAQAAEMDYAPPFQMGHPKAFELALKVAQIMPAGLDRIFFTNSGSESVDTALKIALAYHRVQGDAARTRLIGREKGYHGVGFGGISVGGLVNNRRFFGSGLAGVDHLPHTHGLPENLFSRGQPAHGGHLAEELERLVALHGGETIAAVIVEPVVGSAGVLVPPQNYLQRLRAICDRYGILLIFDEVITGFGRVGGHATAADVFGVRPDIVTMAKGLTGGAVPMGAVAVDRRIHDAFMQGPENAIELFHGYTYSGHPLAAAAGLATLEVYEEEGLFARTAELAPYWEKKIHALRGLPHVIDIRNIGLMGAIELAPRGGQPGARAFAAFLACFEKGLLVRVTADTIALSPPLIVSKAQIDEIFGILGGIIKTLD